MSRFEEVQNLLMDGEFESGLDYFTIHDYLRDLKISHEVLVAAVRTYFERARVDAESNYQLESYHELNAALKIAEGLK